MPPFLHAHSETAIRHRGCGRSTSLPPPPPAQHQHQHHHLRPLSIPLPLPPLLMLLHFHLIYHKTSDLESSDKPQTGPGLTVFLGEFSLIENYTCSVHTLIGGSDVVASMSCLTYYLCIRVCVCFTCFFYFLFSTIVCVPVPVSRLQSLER